MPIFKIRALNSKFETQSVVEDQARPEDAMALGVRGAAAMAAEDIEEGSNTAAVQVTIEDTDSRPLLKSVVSVCVAPLFIG